MSDHTGVGVAPAKRPQAVVGNGQHEQERRRPRPAMQMGGPTRRRPSTGQPAPHPRRGHGLRQGEHGDTRPSTTPSSTASTGSRREDLLVRRLVDLRVHAERERHRRPRSRRRRSTAPFAGRRLRRPARRGRSAIRSRCVTPANARLETWWRSGGGSAASSAGVVVQVVQHQVVLSEPALPHGHADLPVEHGEDVQRIDRLVVGPRAAASAIASGVAPRSPRVDQQLQHTELGLGQRHLPTTGPHLTHGSPEPQVAGHEPVALRLVVCGLDRQ